MALHPTKVAADHVAFHSSKVFKPVLEGTSKEKLKIFTIAEEERILLLKNFPLHARSLYTFLNVNPFAVMEKYSLIIRT